MTDGDTGAPLLVLGPLLRYVGETEATVWVETDRACQVEILGHQARTFEVSGHHYGAGGDRRPAAGRGVRVPGRPGRRRPLAGARIRSSRRACSGHRTRAGRSGSPSVPAGSPSCRVPRRRQARARPASRQSREPGPSRQARAARPGASRSTGRTRWSPAPWTCARRRASAGPTWCCCSATRSTPTRPRRTPSSASGVVATSPKDFRRAGRGLRGIHLAVPRVVDRSRCALAAVHRAVIDDLRRSRRAGRLEHLAFLAAGHAGAAVVARERIVGAWCPRTGSTSTWATCPPTNSPRTCCGGRCRSQVTRPPCSPTSPPGPTSRCRLSPTRGSGGVTGAPSAARGLSRSDSRGGRQGSRRATGSWCARGSGGGYRVGGRRLGSPGPGQVPCRCCSRPAYTRMEAWNEAVCGGAWGPPPRPPR